MRRFLAATAATVLGLVLLLTYRTGHARLAGGVALGSSSGGTVASATQTPGAAASAGPVAAGAKDGSFDGPQIQTPFGVVQVRISVSGKKVVNIVNLQLPNDREYSQQLSAYAGPILIQEAIAAQSPSINVVSGASYTSDGFAQSLQGAMQQAGLA